VGTHQTIANKPLAHRFLDYNRVYVYFIYSFTWNISRISWEGLWKSLNELNQEGKDCVWRRYQLHVRQLGLKEKKPQTNSNSTYQPTLVTQKQVFETTQSIEETVNLLVPTNQEPKKGSKTIGGQHFNVVESSLGVTIRLFDNGVATCSFMIGLEDTEAVFENIHYVQHLAHNVDSRSKDKKIYTDSYIEIPSSDSSNSELTGLFPKRNKNGKCSLHEMYYQILQGVPHCIPSKLKDQKIWASEIEFEQDKNIKDSQDKENKDDFIIKLSKSTCNFQSPFLFTVAEIEQSSYNEFLEDRSTETNKPTTTEKEVASILCKFTLDNDYIYDFHKLSNEYLSDILRYKSQKGPLGNLCLDERLFFTISRRGAIAITADLAQVPSFFVVPSLLNLCEIFRARWYLGSIVSARLDRALIQIAQSANAETSFTEEDSPVPIDPLTLMETMFRWRTLSGSFLRNPVPFLFDGGSVTEIAEIAEDLLWLNELTQEIEKKFELLDQLVRDYLNIDRQRYLRKQT
jgi:hypothetical protein